METFKKCKVKNCENEYNTHKGGGLGYCQKHHWQMWKYGKILERTMSDPNEIIDCGDYYEICLYNRKNEEVSRTLIDKEDLEKIKQYKWCLDKHHGYVVTKKIKKIRMQRFVMNKKAEFYVDHINHNKLDNRKQNLRYVTKNQNQWNRKSKGYSFKKNKWEAHITMNYKYIHLGRFIKEQDAQKAVQEARQKYFGEFAYKKTN